MERDICETIRERIGQDFDGECHLTEAEAKEIVAAVESLRSELDEARKALQRLASVETFTTPFMRRDNAEAQELVARIDFAERASAIRQKGESDE